MSMTIGVPKEVHPGERRVAMTPDSARQLAKLGYRLLIEADAGAAAKFTDQAYQEAGVEVLSDTRELWSRSDIVLKVRAPEQHSELGVDETELLREGGHLISFIWPAQNPELMERLKARKATVQAMDAVPRISRAQKMDALSSIQGAYRRSDIGYRAIARERAGEVDA